MRMREKGEKWERSVREPKVLRRRERDVKGKSVTYTLSSTQIRELIPCHFVLFSCKSFNNLNSFFAVTIGLMSVAVTRLRQTWKEVPLKLRTRLEQFQALTVSLCVQYKVQKNDQYTMAAYYHLCLFTTSSGKNMSYSYAWPFQRNLLKMVP